MLRTISILISMGIIVGCSSGNYRAPVKDRSLPYSMKIYHHTVSKGETLFSIAWRYGLDYRTLASFNNIPSPYTIYPGQKLSLKPSPSRTTISYNETSRQPLKPQYKPVVHPVGKSAGPVRPASKPVTTPKPAPVSNRSKTATKTIPVKSQPVVTNSQSKWQWPLRGEVITSFAASQGLSKGIDIAGRLGESVTAAGPGVVVYAGNGLRGYGNLLIIKHDDTYLSAYAHNRRLLVKEGAVVKAGQQIAEVGSSGTDKVKLHFEIRREGSPVDPMKYLPR